MSDKIEMMVKLEVTVPQALALQAMFAYWNSLASMGGSRKVAFYVDGDGNFKPNALVSFSEKIPELTKEMKEKCIVDGKTTGDLLFDYDPIAWMLHKED